MLVHEYSTDVENNHGIREHGRYFPLDFIRAISILLIIFFHYNCAVERFAPIGKVFFKYYFFTGNIGVSMFFILSGASLMISTRRDFSLINFYKKRFFAIYPLFWTTYIVLVIGILIILQSNPFQGRNPVTFFLTIIGLDGLLAYRIPNYYLIGEWFLGCIIILYVLFPIIRCLFHKNKEMLLIGSVIACVLLEKYYSLDIPLNRFPLFRIVEVVFGMYLISLFSGNISRIKNMILAVASFIALIIVFQFDITRSFIISYIAIGMLTFVFLFSASTLSSGSIPKHVVGFLSEYSYAAFLLHHIIINVVVKQSKYILNSMGSNTILLSVLVGFIFLNAYIIQNSLRYTLLKKLASST